MNFKNPIPEVLEVSCSLYFTHPPFSEVLLNLFSSSSTMQYVIFMYMKHLGVKVKEPRNLEHKRGRIGFLPKIKVRLGGHCVQVSVLLPLLDAFLLSAYFFSNLVQGAY